MFWNSRCLGIIAKTNIKLIFPYLSTDYQLPHSLCGGLKRIASAPSSPPWPFILMPLSSTNLIKLVCSSQTRGSRAHYSNFLPRPGCWWFRFYPTLLKGMINDGALNVLDSHWKFIDAQYTSPFTRGRTDTACELCKSKNIISVLSCTVHTASQLPIPNIDNTIAKIFLWQLHSLSKYLCWLSRNT